MAFHSYDWEARETGVNAADLSASTDSNAIAVNDADLVILDFEHANTSGALTITGSVQGRKRGDADWTYLTQGAVAAGVETLSRHSMSRLVAGAERWSWAIAYPGFDELRVAAITAAGAAATDTLTMRARVRLPL